MSRVLLTAVVVLLAAVMPLSAGAIDFNALPSTQGWTFVTGGAVSESENVTLSGGVLAINTMGEGTGYGWYQSIGVYVTGVSSLVFRARALASEDDFGFAFGIYDGNAAYIVGLGAGEIKSYMGSHTAYDTSVFRTYVLEVDHDNAMFTLSSGGSQIFAGTGIANTDNLVLFGDITSGGNAHGELTWLEYGRQPGYPGPTEIPEPGTFALLALGAAAFLALPRARRRN